MKVLFCALLLLAGCEREPYPELVGFTFQVPFTLTPIRDTVAVGDTLWLAADFSDQLQDFTSGQRYPVTPANFELRTIMGFRQLVYSNKTSGDQPGATGNFGIISKVGSVTQHGTTFNDVNYSYAQGRYHLRVGLVPRTPGVYCIFLLDGWGSRGRDEDGPDLSYIDLGVNQDGVKRRPIFDAVFYGINDGQTNFNLFQQHCRAISLTVPTDSNINYEQKATYTFVVK